MQINLGSFRQELILNSSNYLNETGKLFLLKSDSILGGNIITASQAETGFVIIPLISTLTNLSVNSLINILFFVLILITLTICLYSSFKLSKNINSKIFSLIVCVLIIFLSYPLYLNKYAEYSLNYFFGLLALYPIYLLANNKLKPSSFFFQICTLSFFAVIFGLFRDYVFLNLSLIFGYILLFKLKSKKLFKLVCILILISPVFITQTITHKVSKIMNDNYQELIINNPDNKFYKNVKEDILLGQSLWHSLYVSLAFLENNIVKGSDGYNDDTLRNLLGRDKAYDWHFYSSDDEVIKKEIINILFNHPTLVFKTLFAKIGVILGYLLIITNIGLVMLVNIKKIKENVEMVSVLSINILAASIFPLVAIPTKVYLGGIFSSGLIILYLFILNFLNKPKLK